MNIARALNLDDVKKLARRRLPRSVFETIEGGSGDETTLGANRKDLDSVRLIPKSLIDVSNVDATISIFDQKMSFPFMLAPCSFGRICDPEGERAVARAAGETGAGYIVPGGSSEPLESVAESATGPLWYQIYMKPDDQANEELLERVQKSKYQALVVSVDTPIKPYRERDLRNNISLPLTINPKLVLAGMSRPRWAKGFILGNKTSGFSFTAARSAYYNFESAMSGLRPVTLKDIEWLRERWSGPLIVKGLLNTDKIRDLVDVGVDGVSVSNHGGRNLDGVSSAIAALPRIVDIAAGDLEVFVDGGIRRGTDVIRARALGATACLVGRPYMYGLAAAGQTGVEKVINLLGDEVKVALAMLGCRTMEDVTRDLLQNQNIYR